jgi:hypothetical protein
VIKQAPTLIENEDRWILPFQGITATQIPGRLAFELNLDDHKHDACRGSACHRWAKASPRPRPPWFGQCCGRITSYSAVQFLFPRPAAIARS